MKTLSVYECDFMTISNLTKTRFDMKKQYQRSAANAATEAKNSSHRADLIGLDFRMIATTPEGGNARAVFPAGTPRGALDDFLRKAGSAILEKERCSGKNTPPCSPVGNFSDEYTRR